MNGDTVTRRLTFEVTITNPDRWTMQQREAALADLESSNYIDYVERQLLMRMDGAAEAFIATHPEMFDGGPR